jgi:hypothetical protein
MPATVSLKSYGNLIALAGSMRNYFVCFPIASLLAVSSCGLRERGRQILDFFDLFGAGEGIRTLDPNLGKVVLYP